MIFDRLFRAAKTPPPVQYTHSLVTPADSTGEQVSEASALTFSAVYACIRILSETVAQLPLGVFRRTDDGSEPAAGHPVYRLLHATPNRYMSGYVWREVVMGHVVSWGNGYSYIQRNGLGQPNAILPLLPDRTFAELDDGKLVYRTVINNTPVTLPAADVLHIPAFGFDGLSGYSPIRMHRDAIGLGLAAQTFGRKFFANGATLAGILRHPGRLTDKGGRPGDPSPVEQLRADWQKLYGGADKAYKVAILEEGMEYQQIGIPPEDSQYLETRRFQVTEVARIYNVPAHMVNDLEKATFNNISELSIGFLRYTMTPWLAKWEAELNRKLFGEREQDRLYVKFNTGGLLRGTQSDRAEYYSQAITGGWMNRNEVRQLEDMNRVDGLDDYLTPLNMASSGDGAGEGADAGNDTNVGTNDDTVRTFYPLLADFCRRLADADRKALMRGIAGDQPAEAVRRWLADSEQFIRRHLEPTSRALNMATGLDGGVLVRRMIKHYRNLRTGHLMAGMPGDMPVIDARDLLASLEAMVEEMS